MCQVLVPESSLFHHLTNHWTFHDLSREGAHSPGTRTPFLCLSSDRTLVFTGKEGCRTTFDIGFLFRSTLHQKMAETYFHEVSQNMIQVFHERCALVYQRKQSIPSSR